MILWYNSCMSMPSNPHGANAVQLDPRQQLCWGYYIDPRSETFSNAYQSAIKAGYEESSAIKISSNDWFAEKRRTLLLLPKAEKVLEETLDADIHDEEGKRDRGVMGLKLDAAKFVSETIGKGMGYSKRSELTAADGKELSIQVVSFGELDLLNKQVKSDENTS